MYLDVVHMRAFYDLPIGRIVRQHLGADMRNLRPPHTGEIVLGVGYVTPYLQSYLATAERVLAFMPATQGVTRWPRDKANMAALVEEEAWPLPDASIDCLVTVHGLDMVDNPRAFLREAWRVLVPGGRLLAVVPNRSGLWARVETSPFGYGHPYSRAQLGHLLRESMFAPRSWAQGLHFAPFSSRWALSSAGAWERFGRRLWPAFSGAIMVDAEKQMTAGLAETDKGKRSAIFRPVFVPHAAPRAKH
ncbi:MAG: methyltransferase type 11 [Hyphomicrobiales bacterium]|nr:MAG: methyltransferase type 11 [Hyphomicrobiales bacterium]